jgi:hypothetical protein
MLLASQASGAVRLARRLGLAIVAVLAGCVTPPSPPPPPTGPPPLTMRPEIAPNFVVPSPRERMVYLAQQEWTLFGGGVVDYDGTAEPTVGFASSARHEVQPPMLSRVLMYWYAVSRSPIVGDEGELRPWSAAFIAWLARSAGFTREQFPDTVLHWDYIRGFLEARNAATFAAVDPATYTPGVGDLVCNGRGRPVTFATLRPGGYHCDLVVAASPGMLEAIGGNVGDVVALSRLPLDEQGRLVPMPGRPWAVVLRYLGR